MFNYEIYEKLRNSKGLRDKHVADATGITPSTFSDWKSGRSAPKIDKIMKIADFLQVSPAEITQQPVVTVEYNEDEKIKRVHLDEPPKDNTPTKNCMMMLDFNEATLINNYRRLNDMGRGFLDTQMALLLRDEKFSLKQENMEKAAMTDGKKKKGATA
jgi:transcriptional regulator with XRE-family HTH domain